MTLPQGTIIGKYVVRRKLAEGGMAEIFLCSSRGPEGFEKEVVIKRIRSFLANDPSFIEMFIAEAQVASRLNHANVVQIFDFDKHEDTYYLAMEYVPGHSLWDAQKRAKALMVPFPPTLAAQVGVEVARGLAYAHRLTDKNGRPLHLVHRDVTPHNVLLSYDGAVKLTDFGIAKAGTKVTAPGMLKGKFAYMSPEQSRGDAIDARTDIFALGIVLWELLTGAPLFDGNSDVAVLRQVQEREILPPGRLNPDVTPELDAAVLKALARDPAQRFQSARELELALAQYVLRAEQSLEDRDVGAFVRMLFADELAKAEAEHSSGTETDDRPAPPAKVAHEPTFVAPRAPLQPGGGGGTAVFTPAPKPATASQVVEERKAEPNAAPAPMTEAERLAAEASQLARDSRPKARPNDEDSAPRTERHPDHVRPPAASSRKWVGAVAVGLILVVAGAIFVVRGGAGENATDSAASAFALAPSAPTADPEPTPAPKTEPTPAPMEPATVKTAATPTAAVVVSAAATSRSADGTKPHPRPAAATQKGTGTFRIKVKPWAEVRVAGFSQEASPQAVFTLPAGRHQVVVQNQGWREKRYITVEPGREVSMEMTVPLR